MQPTNRTQCVLAKIGRLFRTLGLIDTTPASVKNAGRRLPQARAALLRQQARSRSHLAELRVWASPMGDL